MLNKIKKMDLSTRYEFVGLITLTCSFFIIYISSTINGYHNPAFLVVAGVGILGIILAIWWFIRADRLREGIYGLGDKTKG